MTVHPITVKVRPFRSQDQHAAKDLILAAMEEHWGTIDASKNPDLDDIARTYTNGTFLVAWLGHELVGTGALVHEQQGVARIVRMSVARCLRRHGIGRLILERLVESARSAGYRRVVLETTSTWGEAIAFYKGYGFRIVGSWDGDTHFTLDL